MVLVALVLLGGSEQGVAVRSVLKGKCRGLGRLGPKAVEGLEGGQKVQKEAREERHLEVQAPVVQPVPVELLVQVEGLACRVLKGQALVVQANFQELLVAWVSEGLERGA